MKKYGEWEVLWLPKDAVDESDRCGYSSWIKEEVMAKREMLLAEGHEVGEVVTIREPTR